MAALGVGLVFIGYALGLHGYCLFKGYNVTFRELWSPVWPPGGKAAPTQTNPDSAREHHAEGKLIPRGEWPGGSANG